MGTLFQVPDSIIKIISHSDPTSNFCATFYNTFLDVNLSSTITLPNYVSAFLVLFFTPRQNEGYCHHNTPPCRGVAPPYAALVFICIYYIESYALSTLCYYYFCYYNFASFYLFSLLFASYIII